mmetsp:Transcript_336/g.1041  ORF Transcript_336/g.1041 Transcript_336/m.1041 type:complete len:362 (+) Transcript_336:434-1519(+)
MSTQFNNHGLPTFLSLASVLASAIALVGSRLARAIIPTPSATSSSSRPSGGCVSNSRTTCVCPSAPRALINAVYDATLCSTLFASISNSMSSSTDRVSGSSGPSASSSAKESVSAFKSNSAACLVHAMKSGTNVSGPGATPEFTMLARAFSAASKSPAFAQALKRILYMVKSSCTSRSCMIFKTSATPIMYPCSALAKRSVVKVCLSGAISRSSISSKISFNLLSARSRSMLLFVSFSCLYSARKTALNVRASALTPKSFSMRMKHSFTVSILPMSANVSNTVLVAMRASLAPTRTISSSLCNFLLNSSAPRCPVHRACFEPQKLFPASFSNSSSERRCPMRSYISFSAANAMARDSIACV